MAVVHSKSRAEQIDVLLDRMAQKMGGLSDDLRDTLQQDLGELRETVKALIHTRGEEESAARMKYLSAILSESEARYRELGENLSDPLSIFGSDLRLIYRNPAAEQASQVSNEMAIGKTFEELYPKLVGTELHQKYLDAIETGKTQSYLNRWICPDTGEDCYYEITFYPGRDWLVCISENVTERVEAVEALRQSEKFNRHLIESSSDSIKVLDLDGRLLSINSGGLRLLEAATENAVIGRSWLTLWQEEDWPRVQAAVDAACGGQVGAFQAPRKSFQGKMLWWDVVISPIRGVDDKVERLLVVSRDITERKQAEEALQKSEAQARQQLAEIEAIYANAPIGLCVFDEQLRWKRLNQRIAEINGVPMEDHIGKTPSEIVPDVGQQAEDALKQILETGQPLLDFEMVGTTAAQPGVVRYWNERWTPIKDEQGKITGISVAAEEITERKHAEEALRRASEILQESEGRFRAMADGTPVMIWVHNAQGEIEFINKAWTNYFGPTLDQVKANGWAPIVHPDDVPGYVELFQKCLEERRPFRAQARVRVADGSLRWVDSHGQPRFSDTGEFLGMAGSSIDITEQKRIEAERERLLEELRVQKDLLERLIEFSPIAISMLKGPDHRFVLVNHAQRALFPTIDEYTGRTVGNVWPDGIDAVLQLLDNVYRTGEPFNATDVLWLTDKGNGLEEAFYSFTYAPLYAADGTIEGILVLSKETTDQVRIRQRLEEELEERKQAEAALEKAHDDLVNERNLLRAVMEALPVGLAVYDRHGGVTQSNGGYEAVWGSPRPPVNSVDDYDLYKAWWVDTGERVQADEWASAKSLITGQPVIGQYLRIQRFDGTTGYIVNSGAPVRGASGEIIGGVVTIMDITEQKRLEIERQEVQMKIEVQRRLMDQREKERQGIARDIHDGPIQTLASTAFNIQFVKESFPDPTLAVELNQISLNVKSAVRELREVVNDLRPPSIIRFGLTRAIMMHAEDLRERYPEIELDLYLDEDGARLSDQACLTVFRVFQEGMNNIFRHAGASQVQVKYTVTGAQFMLELRDNGSGFAVPKDFTNLTIDGHYGLAGMKERVEAVGGTFTIASQPGKGTTIMVKGPLVEAKT